MKRELQILTNSEAGTFLSCPMLHHFKYRERLRPKRRPKPLGLGSALHHGIEVGYVAYYRDHLGPLAAIEAALDAVEAQSREWIASVEGTSDYPDIADESEQIVDLVRWMVGHFLTVTKFDRQWELVAVEKRSGERIRDNGGRRSRVVNAGVLDVLWYDRRANSLIVTDHKSTGGDVHGVARRVELDPQMIGYLYGVRELLESRALTLPDGTPVPSDASVGRVVYNVIRKSKPREPSINKNGTVSIAACDTTPDIYRAALHEQEHVRGIPVSEKQRERLAVIESKGDTYFLRIEKFHGPDALERWRWERFETARRIREADREPRARIRNAGHCSMPWSMPCQYRDLCLDPESPELRSMFDVVDDVHPELTAASKRQEGSDEE